MRISRTNLRSDATGCASPSEVNKLGVTRAIDITTCEMSLVVIADGHVRQRPGTAKGFVF